MFELIFDHNSMVLEMSSAIARIPAKKNAVFTLLSNTFYPLSLSFPGFSFEKWNDFLKSNDFSDFLYFYAFFLTQNIY